MRTRCMQGCGASWPRLTLPTGAGKPGTPVRPACLPACSFQTGRWCMLPCLQRMDAGGAWVAGPSKIKARQGQCQERQCIAQVEALHPKRRHCIPSSGAAPQARTTCCWLTGGRGGHAGPGAGGDGPDRDTMVFTLLGGMLIVSGRRSAGKWVLSHGQTCACHGRSHPHISPLSQTPYCQHHIPQHPT